MKKILAIVLALVMMLAVTVPAFAEDVTISNESDKSNTTTNDQVNVSQSTQENSSGNATTPILNNNLHNSSKARLISMPYAETQDNEITVPQREEIKSITKVFKIFSPIDK